MTRIRHVPRPVDDALLSILSARVAGQTTTAIAQAFGIDQQEVSRRTNEVREADAAESGEDVAGAYWAPGQRRVG